MSLEMLRFGWQKLLVNQVPQKGGGGGPPPPDYAGQWNTAQKAFYSGQDTVRWAQTEYSRFTSDGNKNREIIIAVNNRANSEIATLDGIINQTSGIPDYIFADSEVSKGEALRILQGVRSNLAACIAVVPPIVSPPPAPTPPPTSPKVEPAPVLVNPPPTTPPVQMPIGPSVPIGCLPNPVIRCPVDEDISTNEPLQNIKGDWYPTGRVEGYGTWTEEKGLAGYPPGSKNYAIVYDEDGKTWTSIRDVPLNKAWSYKPWRWRPGRLWEDPNAPPPVVAPSKSELEILQAELAKQLKQLQLINRVLNKPIDPAPPQNIYPTTSWQYEFWNKGYSLFEITYAEDEAAKRKLLDTTNGDFALFKAKVEDILQDAILSGNVAKPIVCELYPPIATGTGANGQPVLIAEPVVTPMPYQPYQPRDPGLGQPSVCPKPLPPVQMPVDYFDDNGNRINPKKVPNYLRRRRLFQSQGISNRPIQLADLPSVATCAPNTVPRPSNWEDCLVGAGATVDQLDTIRRAMTQIKLAPNADICAVTQSLLTKLKTSNVRDPLGLAGKPNALTNIPGIVQSGTTTVTAFRSNAIAKATTQQARRGALTSRNRRPTMGQGMNEGGA